MANQSLPLCYLMKTDAMDRAVWNQMPNEFKQLHHCYFKDKGNTEYLIYSVESDTSQLEFKAGSGTCLNPALPRTFEVRVYEVFSISDKPGHFKCLGLSGQFSVNDIHRMAEYYDVAMDEILATKINPPIH